MNSISIPDYLSIAIAPGMATPITAPSTMLPRREEEWQTTPLAAAEAAWIIASRVSEAIRHEARNLYERGAITSDEADKLAWALEQAAGSLLYVMPGNGVLPGWCDPLATVASRIGAPVIRVVQDDSATHLAATERGQATALAIWSENFRITPPGGNEYGAKWPSLRDTAPIFAERAALALGRG